MTLADELAHKRMIKQAVQNAADDATVQVRADTVTQKALWLAVCSIADAYEALQANTDELEKMKADVDEEYAYEKLRLKAERVTGMHIEYLFEKDAIAAQLSGRKP